MPATPPTLEAIQSALGRVLRADEVISPLRPERLAGGVWCGRRGLGWPDGLSAGLIEPADGYRFRPECLALAPLVAHRSVRRLVDLGAGTGALLLIASYLARPERAVAVELQAAQADRLRRTLASHLLDGASTVVVGDLRRPAVRQAARQALGGPADLVVANPPYFPAGWGRPSSNEEVRRSTHAEHGGAREFAAAAVDLLAAQGSVLVVYDAARLAELVAAAGSVGLGIARLLWIPDQRPGRGDEPTRCWVELRLDAAPIDAL